MRISIVIFDEFTDIDLFLMWDLLNRVRVPDWDVRIVGDKSHHISATGLITATHGSIEEANESDVVLFVSGRGTRTKMRDELWLSRFRLDPGRQMIASVCSGALLLAALGLLAGKTATTYPTTKQALEGFGISVEERPFIVNGNVATSGGCLAAQYIVGWVIENRADKAWKELVLKSIQPVGEGLSFSDAPELVKLYAAVPKANAV
ncbi:MAG TPA: DJ-1/PfpI family protein [Blastocatellia bacterium]|jgi:transcriptional regulator GlxA family with amidase domain